MESCASSHSLTALPHFSSRPSTRSGSSTHGRDSTLQPVASISSNESLEPGYRGRFNLPFHNKGRTTGHSSAASSIYEEGTNDRDDSQKENVHPRSGTPLSSHTKKDSMGSSQRTLFGSLGRARSTLRKKTSSPSIVQGTRWDPFMGEPTNASNGRPAQVVPSTYDAHFGVPNNSRYGVEVSITGGHDKPKRQAWVERAAKFGRDAIPEVRPPWLGGSGRSALVDPVRDTTQPPPRNVYTVLKNNRDVPRNGNGSRMGSEESLSSIGGGIPCLTHHEHIEDMSPPFATTPLSHQSKPTNTAVPARKQPPALRSTVSHEQMAPQLAPVTSKPFVIKPLFDDYISRTSTDSDDSTVTVAASKQMQQPSSHFSWSTYAGSTRGYDDEDQEDALSRTNSRSTNEEELISRFSWTTVNTDATYQQDSRPVTPSGSPSPPSKPQQMPSPIMMRRRPVPSQGSISITNNLQADAYATTGGKPGSSSSSRSATDKALPLPPRMDKESTHIEALQARSDELDLRSSNLQRVVADLQKVDRASPLEVTERMRRESRKKLEQVRTALEEVRRERHEVGMALARARSRADKEEGEGSSLWLRRVTG